MRKLVLSKDTFDLMAKFKVQGVNGDVSLHEGYNKKDDGVFWGLQSGTCIKATYTAEDVAHRNRMNKMKPIEKGEIVLINGEQYTARILGNFSDCVIFDKVNT